MRDLIDKVRTYRIYEPHFEKTASLLETGGDASACTEHPVVVAYGTTPQLLVRFKSQEEIDSILTEHLRVLSSRWVGLGCNHTSSSTSCTTSSSSGYGNRRRADLCCMGGRQVVGATRATFRACSSAQQCILRLRGFDAHSSQEYGLCVSNRWGEGAGRRSHLRQQRSKQSPVPLHRPPQLFDLAHGHFPVAVACPNAAA